MYTKRIQLTNYGPIDKLDVQLPFTDQAPQPAIFVGQNGSGKSILLGHVVNGLLSAKDIVYPATPEVEPGRVYKLKTNFYIKSGNQFSFSRVDFENGWYVSEITTVRLKQSYSNVPDGISGTNAERMWKRLRPTSNDCSEPGGNVDFAMYNTLTGSFAKNCVLYFPFNRFEDPAWLNKDNLTSQIGFVGSTRVRDHTARKAIATSPLLDNRNWLFDLLYDRRVPETRTVRVPIPMPRDQEPWYIEAEREEIRDKDEAALKTALQVVQHVLRHYSNASFRMTRRGNRFIGLHGDHGTIVPNIFQLSSGETSLLNLFISILRDFEWAGSSFSSADDIRGIVVIDEVDAHLHAVHQFEILPLLIHMFPNVQFLMTTHSPLFVLGMQRVFDNDGFGLYRLPDGQRISAEEFSEFRDAYETFSSTRKFLDDVARAVEQTNKPVLLTEGEIDLKYLQRASALLGANALLERIEVQNGGGSGNLAKVWKHPMADLLPQKVLLLFDCDTNRRNDDRGNLSQRTMPYHSENPIHKGIENLFSKRTLSRASQHKSAFIDIEREHRAIERGIEKVVPERWTINANEKMNLCNWLCQNGTQDDFKHFGDIFDLIEEALGQNSS